MGIMQALAGVGAGGIEYVGATREAANTSATGNDATIAYPSGVEADDLLLLYTYNPSLDDMITDGWTLEYSSGAGINHYHFHSRVAVGGESGNLTYPTRFPDSPHESALFVVRGWDTVGPADGAEIIGTLPGITMTAPGIWIQVASSGPTITTPGGLLSVERRSSAAPLELTTGYRQVAAGATGSNSYSSSAGYMWGVFGIGITAA